MGDIRILLAGIPGTGKSYFAQWLVEVHGFVPHTADFAGPPSLEVLLRDPRVVLDWGFPAADPNFVPCLQFVKQLIANGFEHWWFDGDRDAALQSYLQRGDVPKANWDVQVPGIEQHWAEISALFKDRQLNVISAGPTHTLPEEIFRQMFPRGLR